MDEIQFDTLTRALVTGPSRRGLLRLVGGLVSAVTVPMLGSGESTAKGKKGGKKKRKKRGGTQTALPTCSPSICAGCCDARGICQPGNTIGACGTGGQPCATCANPKPV